MTTLVITLAIVATAAVVVWFFLNLRNLARGASRSRPDATTTSEQLYGTSDRPAGPDAETMDPDRLGGDHRPPT